MQWMITFYCKQTMSYLCLILLLYWHHIFILSHWHVYQYPLDCGFIWRLTILCWPTRVSNHYLPDTLGQLKLFYCWSSCCLQPQLMKYPSIRSSPGIPTGKGICRCCIIQWNITIIFGICMKLFGLCSSKIYFQMWYICWLLKWPLLSFFYSLNCCSIFI